MSEKSIDKLMQEVLERKLADGSIEQVMSDKIDKIIEKVVDDAFSWNAPAYKELKEKTSQIMLDGIGSSNLTEYTVKITEVLDQAFKNNIPLHTHKIVTDNLKMLLEPRDEFKYGSTVSLEDIIEKYKDWIKHYYEDKKYQFDSSDIENADPDYEYGYTYIDAYIDIEEKEQRYSSYQTYFVKLSCQRSDQDPETEISFVLSKRRDKEEFDIEIDTDYKLSQIRYLNELQIYLLRLKQSFTRITAQSSTLNTYDTEVHEVCIEFTEE